MFKGKKLNVFFRDLTSKQLPVRYLNLLEYQSKNLLKQHGVAIQDFCIVDQEDKSPLNKFGKLIDTVV